jgi:putative tRNA adenosine deaminase-associated protein
MSDFDDDEYESFELRAARARDEAETRTDAQSAEEDLSDPDDDDDDDDDFDDDDDDDDDDDFDDDDDDLEDATEDEIDFVVAAYREDGLPVAQALRKDLANDLDEMVEALRRLPGDAGALGFVSLTQSVFVIVRVRGQLVQVLLSDGGAGDEWPIARDVADYLGVAVPDNDDPLGDLDLLGDLGIGAFELEAISGDFEETSEDLVFQIVDKLKIGPEFRRVVQASFH